MMLKLIPMSGPAKSLIETYLNHTGHTQDKITIHNVAQAELMAYNFNVNIVLSLMKRWKPYAKNAQSFDYYYLGMIHDTKLFKTGMDKFDDMGIVCLLLYKRLIYHVTSFDPKCWTYIKELSKMHKEAIDNSIAEVRDRYRDKFNIPYILAVARNYELQIAKAETMRMRQDSKFVSDLQNEPDHIAAKT
jgi:hypothetical protein